MCLVAALIGLVGASVAVAVLILVYPRGVHCDDMDDRGPGAV